MIQLTRPLTGNIEHVWSGDASLDREHPSFDYDKFVDTGDMAHIPLKDGMQPAFFSLGRLPLRAYEQCVEMLREGRNFAAMILALEYGLKGMRNVQVNGESYQLRFAKGQLGERISDDAREILIRSMALCGELGGRIIKVSQIDPL